MIIHVITNNIFKHIVLATTVLKQHQQQQKTNKEKIKINKLKEH